MFEFGPFQKNMHLASREKYIFHMLFGAFHITPRIVSWFWSPYFKNRSAYLSKQIYWSHGYYRRPLYGMTYYVNVYLEKHWAPHYINCFSSVNNWLWVDFTSEQNKNLKNRSSREKRNDKLREEFFWVEVPRNRMKRIRWKSHTENIRLSRRWR